MNNYKIVFIIDKLELQYFEMNELVTSFWLIKECNLRNWEVFITTSDRLSLRDNIPNAFVFKTNITGSGSKVSADTKVKLLRQKESSLVNLNEFNLVVFRPDPPVDMDYIFSTYILDYIDNSKTCVINSPAGIRNANEKLYINNFPDAVPSNITTGNPGIIKDFLNQYGEIIIKPLNKCFGKGVFYLKKGDKNINTILDLTTDGGKKVVMVQEYIKNVKNW